MRLCVPIVILIMLSCHVLTVRDEGPVTYLPGALAKPATTMPATLAVRNDPPASQP